MKTKSKITLWSSLVVFLAVIGILAAVFWVSILHNMSGGDLFTRSQLNDAREQGYAEGVRDRNAKLEQLDLYRVTKNALTNQVEQLQVEMLEMIQVGIGQSINNATLQAQMASLLATIVTLETTITWHEGENERLRALVASLEFENADLYLQLQQDENVLAHLRAQIAGLEENVQVYKDLIAQFQLQHEETVTFFELQIANLLAEKALLSNNANTLESLIEQLITQIEALGGSNTEKLALTSQLTQEVNSLRYRVAGLEASVGMYQELLDQIERDNRLTVTFMVDGVVFNVQVVVRNEFAQITPPTSTLYREFNGWRVNGTLVNPATFPISQNTIFVADLTIRHRVTWMDGDSQHASHIVPHGGFPVVPVITNTPHRTFLGWSLNGTTLFDPATHEVGFPTTFHAMFRHGFDIVFTSLNNAHHYTRIVKDGDRITAPSTSPSSDRFVFRGWRLSGSTNIVTVNHVVTGPMTFRMVYDRVHFVTFHMGNGTNQVRHVVNGQNVTPPSNPAIHNAWTQGNFMGWSTTANGAVVNPTSTPVTGDRTYHARFNLGQNATLRTHFYVRRPHPADSGRMHYIPNTMHIRINNGSVTLEHCDHGWESYMARRTGVMPQRFRDIGFTYTFSNSNRILTIERVIRHTSNPGTIPASNWATLRYVFAFNPANGQWSATWTGTWNSGDRSGSANASRI